MMVMMRMGGAVPQAPGNIGLYLMANEIMKRIFAVPARDADSFSMVLWGILTLRLVIGGIIASRGPRSRPGCSVRRRSRRMPS